MSLKKSFFLLTFCGLLISLLLLALIWKICYTAINQYPSGGVSFNIDGTITKLPNPTPEQLRISSILGIFPILACITLPILGLSAAAALFFRWKLQPPIKILLEGTRRIQNHDLDFVISDIAADELGQVCAAFETMRTELQQTNQQLWRQAEERRRLNAAFAHDLRNPVTVLKGTVKLLQQNKTDEQAIKRLAAYTERIEQYIASMSSIQKLEQIPIQTACVNASELRAELEETARLLAPGLKITLQTDNLAAIQLDKSVFFSVAENLISNAARFAQQELIITLRLRQNFISLTVTDDGPGYPLAVLQNGPQPFSKTNLPHTHLGMGLYSCQILCNRHGGWLKLQNRSNSRQTGAQAAAFFKIS